MKHEEQLTCRRLVAASPQDDDLQPGEEIRPRRLDDYIGQEQVKQSLRIFIQAARQRGIKAGELVLGQDDFCMNYLMAYRAGQLGPQ